MNHDTFIVIMFQFECRLTDPRRGCGAHLSIAFAHLKVGPLGLLFRPIASRNAYELCHGEHLGNANVRL